jgi:hypothetical protein
MIIDENVGLFRKILGFIEILFGHPIGQNFSHPSETYLAAILPRKSVSRLLSKRWRW